MPEIERLIIKDGNQEYEMYVESNASSEISDEEEPGYRDGLSTVNLEKIHNQIRGYTKYAIDAFRNFGGAEVEEVNLKFGLKIGGKTGLPILASGSTEGNFEIQLKCKFNNTSK